MATLKSKNILVLHQTAIDLGLADSRSALLSGIDQRILTSLPVVPTPGGQLLSDLHTLNRARHGDVPPLHQWLENAAALSSHRAGSEIFRDALSALPEALDSSRQRLHALHGAEVFVGRDYLFSAMESFLESERCGYLIVQGESGTGKSAFVAECVRRTGCVAYFHDRAAAAQALPQITEGIGALLRDRFDVQGYSTPGWSRRPGAFADLLKACARQLAPREALVIAVDAVDEIGFVGPAKGANPLNLPVDLPDHVFFVLTSRRRSLSLTVNTAQQRVHIGEHEEENMANVLAFLDAAAVRVDIRAWLETIPLQREAFVSALARRSQGNFMYLCCVLRGIGEGRYADRGIESLPRDLYHCHEERWNGLVSVTSLPNFDRDAIAYVFAEANRPISPSDLVTLTGATERVVGVMIAALADLLIAERDGERVTYRIAHSSFREFLYWQDCVQARGVALAGAHPTMDATLNTLLGSWRDEL